MKKLSQFDKDYAKKVSDVVVFLRKIGLVPDYYGETFATLAEALVDAGIEPDHFLSDEFNVGATLTEIGYSPDSDEDWEVDDIFGDDDDDDDDDVDEWGDVRSASKPAIVANSEPATEEDEVDTEELADDSDLVHKTLYKGMHDLLMAVASGKMTVAKFNAGIALMKKHVPAEHMNVYIVLSKSFKDKAKRYK